MEASKTEQPVVLLKRSLLMVFMAAAIYNATATIKFLEQKQAIKDVLLELFKSSKTYKTPMEQKTFVLGLSNIITAVDVPEEVKNSSTVAKLISEILVLLAKVKAKE